MAKKARKARNVKKAKKKPAKKSLTLRRKALRDLPAKKTSKVTGGSTLTDSLTPSQRRRPGKLQHPSRCRCRTRHPPRYRSLP